MNASVSAIVGTVASLAPAIARGLPDRRQYVQGENPSGEEQVEADVWANEQFKEALTAVNGVGQYASEEEPAATDCGTGVSVTVDPLDGSSNIPTNNLIGTIVGVYDGDLPCAGTRLVASLYVLYGPLTTMIVAHDNTVTEYVLTWENGEVNRLTAAENIMLPEPTVYGFGGKDTEWSPEFSRFAEGIRGRLKRRYGGCLVGDVNQVLHKGGLFAYPALSSRPKGKLRLLFEAAPVAYIIETAGGASSNGDQSLLTVEPEALHERTPVFLGNTSLITELENAL